MDITLFDRALQLVERYVGHKRRCCGETDVEHCRRVGERVRELGRGHLDHADLEQVAVAGVLHDLVEDGVSWNDVEALAALRLEIQHEFGITFLIIVEEVTVDQRLGPAEQFDTFRTRTPIWSLGACLVKWADIEDNAPTRHMYNATYLDLWEAYATDMLRTLIPARLRQLKWEGPLPPAHLPPYTVPDLGTS